MRQFGHNGSARDSSGSAADYVRAAPPLVQEGAPAGRAGQRLAAPDGHGDILRINKCCLSRKSASRGGCESRKPAALKSVSAGNRK